MMLSRFSNLGTGTCMKPVFIFASIALTAALLFNVFLLTGCTTPSPGLRRFHLVSLHYNPNSSKSNIIKNLDGLLKSDKGKNTFSNLRVGYRGICIETSDSKWHCGKHGRNVFNSTSLGGDPLDLVAVADIYKDKIAFPLPLWGSLVCVAIAWIAASINNIPFIPVHSMTRKIAAVGSGCATLLLLGSMVLQQVTTSAVGNLVGQLGVGAVLIDIGNANRVFGWTAFALVFVTAVGTAAVVVAEVAVDKVRTKAEKYVDEGVNKASGGRVDLEGLRGFTNTVQGGFAQGNGNNTQKPAKAAVSIATKLLHRR